MRLCKYHKYHICLFSYRGSIHREVQEWICFPRDGCVAAVKHNNIFTLIALLSMGPALLGTSYDLCFANAENIIQVISFRILGRIQ